MSIREVLDLLCCPTCGDNDLTVGAGRRPELVCAACEAKYPIVDGVFDLTPRDEAPRPGDYRTETLFNLIAGVFDLSAPLTSLAVWQCSPLRYMDLGNRTIGRANPGGVVLDLPVGTGIVLDHVLADYHDVRVIAVERSWKMLDKARRRFEDGPRKVQLVRADYARLPIRAGVIDSIHSANGLHSFARRPEAIAEMKRVLDPVAGFWGGSALVRGHGRAADLILERYERYGVFPMLRSAEFLLRELQSELGCSVRFETHGSVAFFTAALEDEAEVRHVNERRDRTRAPRQAKDRSVG